MLLFSIIAREFRSAARKKRMHGLRLLFGGAMATWFCVVALKNTLDGGEALGRAVYDAIMLPLAYGLMLIAPALAAPSIAQERREDTLGLLFLTKLRPYHIVLAKFTARIVELLWFVLLALPFLALPIWFGGVGHAEVISDVLILLGLAFFWSALGLCASAFFRLATSAFVAALFILAFLDFTLFCEGVERLRLYLVSGQNQVPLSFRSAWQSIFDESYQVGNGLFNVSSLLLPSNTNEVIAGAADLGLAGVGTLTLLGLAASKMASLSYLSTDGSDLQWQRRFKTWNRIGNWMAAFVFVTLIVVGVVGLLLGANRTSVLWGFWNWQFWNTFLSSSIELVAFLIPLVLVAIAIVSEKEARTLESLVCTPLSNTSLVNGKLADVWSACWGWFLLLRAPLVMTILMGRPTEWTQYLILVLQAIAYLSLIFSIGAFCSAWSRNFAQAVTFSITCASLVYILITRVTTWLTYHAQPPVSIALAFTVMLALAAGFYLPL